MTTEDDFQKQLDEHPDDWQTRLVFADWLQDQDDPRAEGYRALGSLRKEPEDYGPDIVSGHPFTWWKQTWANVTVDNLPADWWECLEGGYRDSDVNRDYLTRREAIDAAVLAFAKLPAERRAELLNQDWLLV